MKKEYDFTDAEQGKFYRPLEELEIPIYLDSEVKDFLLKSIKNKRENISLSEVVNFILKKDIEISKNFLLN